MFISFFPRPKLLFTSAVLWSAVAMLLWFFGGEELGGRFGMGPLAEGATPVASVALFYSPAYLWFYLYFFAAIALFCGFWTIFSPHRWSAWSLWGTSLIVFVVNFSVQTSVALNYWNRSMYDLIQTALDPGTRGTVTIEQFYGLIVTFVSIATIYIVVAVLNVFFVSHWVFRWRTAMNEYYTAFWPRLRHIEGASQRIQEDTMRFSQTIEGLGVSLVDSVMTLFAFLPLLAALSANFKSLPVVGEIPYSLVWAALGWAVFGTVLLAVVGVKLPGLYFRNQRVEAAYRKELVIGEDLPERAQPPTLAELFGNVRKNYFTLYFHYLYFNVARYVYLQTNVIYSLLVMGPTIIAGAVTLGIFQQVRGAFVEVTSSFQYLVNSWSTIVELLSIHKRLHAFEATIRGEPLPAADQHYLEREQAGLRPEDQPAT